MECPYCGSTVCLWDENYGRYYCYSCHKTIDEVERTDFEGTKE